MRLAELDIPARPEFVSLAPLIMGSVVGRYDISDDQIENLKLAISEACVLAMEADTGGNNEVIHIACDGAIDRLEISVDAPIDIHINGVSGDTESERVDSDQANVERSLGLPIIGSLVDEVALEGRGELRVLRMTFHCALAELL